jgi:hypothetical protein
MAGLFCVTFSHHGLSIRVDQWICDATLVGGEIFAQLDCAKSFYLMDNCRILGIGDLLLCNIGARNGSLLY